MKHHRIAILFDNFGPYHRTRLKSCAKKFDLLAIEFGESSSEYSWARGPQSDFRSVTLNPGGASEQMDSVTFESRLFNALNDFKPEVVAIPGWGFRGALLALMWCLRNRIPAVLMSDSTEWDHRRVALKEWIKSKIVKCFSAAFVAGAPHRCYLELLGFPSDRISDGYDVVDNEYFQSQSEAMKGQIPSGLAKRLTNRSFLLASARFVDKKNLHFLIHSYAQYRIHVELSSNTGDKSNHPLDLVVLGDGPLRESLLALRSELGLVNCVHFPGFVQHGELPAYYANASVFIHPSSTDQWGLVVNEAMASGLPVLVSNRCGCSQDLVQVGNNGFVFDPDNSSDLATLLVKVTSWQFPLDQFGAHSRRVIADWTPERFVNGLDTAALLAVGTPIGSTFFSQCLIRGLLKVQR